MILHLLTDALSSSILITGLVVVMMMMIECLNVESKGRIFKPLRRSRFGQVVLSSLLGSVPGCMGGFATVSLYTHGMISFGALTAMMIASCGDEAFVMLALIPEQSLWIFLFLLILAVAAGSTVDLIWKEPVGKACDEHFSIHDADECEHRHDSADGHGHGRHLTWKRAVLSAGTAVFIAALTTGLLGHDEDSVHSGAGFNLLGEEWMQAVFGIMTLGILAVLIFASDHFIEEHLWHHIAARHLPRIFIWTFGILAALNFGTEYLDIDEWISGNTAVMILLAALIGIIPESGPHLIFVTLYASGVIPLPVLLTSCISQDGHSSLPLLAESKRSFIVAKAVNCIIALAAGFGALLLR